MSWRMIMDAGFVLITRRLGHDKDRLYHVGYVDGYHPVVVTAVDRWWEDVECQDFHRMEAEDWEFVEDRLKDWDCRVSEVTLSDITDLAGPLTIIQE